MKNTIITSVVLALSVGTVFSEPNEISRADQRVNTAAFRQHLRVNRLATMGHNAVNSRSASVYSQGSEGLNTAIESASSDDERFEIGQQRRRLNLRHSQRTQELNQAIEMKNNEIALGINQASANAHEKVEEAEAEYFGTSATPEDRVSFYGLVSPEPDQTIRELRSQSVSAHNQRLERIEQSLRSRNAQVRNSVYTNTEALLCDIEGYEEETAEAAETVEEGF